MTSAYAEAEKVEIIRTPVLAKDQPTKRTDDSKWDDVFEAISGLPQKFTYDRDFQIKILGVMVKDFDFLKYVEGNLKREYFTDKITAELFSIITNIHSTHKCPITTTSLTEEVRKLIKAGKIEEIDKALYAKRLASVDGPVTDAAYIRAEVQRFVQHTSLEVGLVQAVALHKRGKYDEALAMLNTSCAEADFNKAKDYAPLDKAYLKERLKRRTEIIESPERFRGIPTGIPPLDRKLFWGGLGKKELGVVMAPPNGGKSPFLLHVAAAGLKQSNVIFYSLEIDQLIFDLRLDAHLTGISINDLTKMSAEDVEEEVKDRLKGLKGNLFVNDLPPFTLTPATLERDIEGYKRRGINPDLIVIDYADLMAPDHKRKERRHEFSDIYTQLRGVAKKFNVGVWTASQSNRKSYKKSIIRLDDIAEDWGKAMVADYVIGLCQTDEEAKKKPAQMRLFFAKNRNGEKEISIKTTIDFSKMRMFIIEVAEEDEFDAYGDKKRKVRELIEAGCDREEVMEKTKCTEQYYYKIKKEMEAEKTLVARWVTKHVTKHVCLVGMFSTCLV